MNLKERRIIKHYKLIPFFVFSMLTCFFFSAYSQVINLNDTIVDKKTSVKDGTLVTVTGTLRQVGSSKFSELVVSTDEGVDVYLKISTEKKNEILKMTYGKVKAKGIVKSFFFYSGNDKKHGFTRIFLKLDEISPIIEK